MVPHTWGARWDNRVSGKWHSAVRFLLINVRQSEAHDITIACYYRICWPFDGDQPAAAAHLSENLGVAFELVEVRTGNGLQPLCRTGQAPQGTREAVGVEIRTVIDASRGQQGAEMRKQAEKIKVKFAEAWEGGGTTKSAIRAFLNPFFK